MAYKRRIFSTNFATSTTASYKNRWGKIGGKAPPAGSTQSEYTFADGSVLFDLQDMTDFYNRRNIITGNIVLYFRYTTKGDWFALGETTPERSLYPKRGRTTSLESGDYIYQEGPLCAPGLYGSITALSAEETYGGYSYNIKITFPFSRLNAYYNGEHSESMFKNGFFLKGGYIQESGSKRYTNSSTVIDPSVPFCMEYTTNETEYTYTYNVKFNTNNQYSSQTFPTKSYTYKSLSSTAPSITVALPNYQYTKVRDPSEIREYTHTKWNTNSSGTGTSYNIGGNITLTNGKVSPSASDAVNLYGVWNSSLIDENEVIYINASGTPMRVKVVYSDGTKWYKTKVYYCDGTQFIKCTAPIG